MQTFNFNRVGPGYRGSAKLVIIDQYVGIPGEEYTRNYVFTDVEFYTVSNAPTLYRINVRL
jgi:hypothetical protein